MDSSLNIIHVARVTPSNSDSSEPLTLPLTFFDLLWFKLHAVERVIFYRLTEATRPFFDSVIVPNLKTSLSSSLSHYLPLAGKLVWEPLDPKPSIVYSPNDAVSFIVAESNADFSRLTGKEPFSSTELHPLVPELQNSDDSASVMSFQVTLFPNQGFCIGLSAHHAVSDGKTTTSFLKSWAYTCKHQDSSLPEDLIPFYDRTVIKGPPNGDIKVLNSWHSLTKMFSGGKEPENPKSLKLPPSPMISPDVVRYTLELSPEDIQTLRERLKRESSSSAKELRLSTFVITYSYALTCLMRARGGDPNRPTGFGFVADSRKLVNPPIPSSYFGNCATGTFRVPLPAETFMGEEGFLASTRLVSELVKKLDESMVWKIPDYVAFSTLPPGTQIVSVAGSTRFGVYGLDFGWGKPEKVVIVSIDQGEAISLAENRDGTGGVEIGFSLKKHEMDALIDLLHNGHTPSTTDSSESLTLPLTFFDLLWLKHKAVERVIFYRLTDVTRPIFDSVIVPNLKSSLSLTLSHYLPLAGQLTWKPLDPKPNIVYSPNDTVSFTVAESNADLSRLIGKEPFSSTELYPLVPELHVSDDSASAVSFQVTLFPNQGFCIGLTAHHAVADGRTATMFLKSWAHICKHQDSSLPYDLIPTYDRTVIKGPPEIDTKVLNIWHNTDKPKGLKLLPKPKIDSDVVRYTFELTREDIEKLRERLKRESSSSSLRLSTFVITFSYVFSCLIGSGGDDPNRPVGLRFAVDCRRLINPPLPLTYFGNCVYSAVKIPLMAGMFLGEEGFVAAARLISDSVEELDSNVVWKIPEVLETIAKAPVESQFVSVAGSPRFGLYGLDFGWGKPVKTLLVSIEQRGKISMVESRDGSGGVEIGFSLKKQEMNVLIDLLHKGIK